MRSRDVQDELADGFEPAALPPMSQDGAPQLEPVRDLTADPPRLCEAGPCRRYHVMQIQLDAQQPLGERRADGTVVAHGRVFHTETHHYCYPDVGIETNLGSLPVLGCNRWTPITSLFRSKDRVRRQYERELEQWHRDREDDADAAGDVASDVRLVAVVWSPGFSCELPVIATDTVRSILSHIDSKTKIPTGAVMLEGEPLENIDVTLAELGYLERDPDAAGVVEVTIEIRDPNPNQETSK